MEIHTIHGIELTVIQYVEEEVIVDARGRHFSRPRHSYY
jgi:hypothetical protein